LEPNGIHFVAGVPDSLLSDVCAAISARLPPECHVIAANEGAAIGLAIGSYLATGQPGLVYLQNSGLGNAINPLASLADPAIYGIPMVLMVGWRGEMLDDGTQRNDEPQHVTQGRITLDQLTVLGIAYRIVDAGTDIQTCLRDAAELARRESRPTALVVRKGAFGAYRLTPAANSATLSREAAIAAIVDSLPGTVPIVSTTGMASRELFELRAKAGTGHQRDFLTVGGMGHAVSIASGIALARPGRKVVCLDGDGAMLMQMGALTQSAVLPNLVHFVLNNAAHDSVGGQPTAATRLSLTDIARSCGYSLTLTAEDSAGVAAAVGQGLAHPGSVLLEILCRRGARGDLGRPTRTPLENKRAFMGFLAETHARA
jgi:phosphonopyruvate decarboxylase